jgi:hypothetical protein
MEVLYPRCAGLDVHAGSVTACARIASGGQVIRDGSILLSRLLHEEADSTYTGPRSQQDAYGSPPRQRG